MLMIATFFVFLMLYRWATESKPISVPAIPAPIESIAVEIDKLSIAVEPLPAAEPQLSELPQQIADVVPLPYMQESLKSLHYTKLRKLCDQQGIIWQAAAAHRGENLSASQMRQALLAVQSKAA